MSFVTCFSGRRGSLNIVYSAKANRDENAWTLERTSGDACLCLAWPFRALFGLFGGDMLLCLWRETDFKACGEETVLRKGRQQQAMHLAQESLVSAQRANPTGWLPRSLLSMTYPPIPATATVLVIFDLAQRPACHRRSPISHLLVSAPVAIEESLAWLEVVDAPSTLLAATEHTVQAS